MKWVRVAIGAVIVLAIIPLIISSINDLSGGEGYQGEYEILITEENINEKVPELVELIEVDESDNVTNYVNVIADDFEIEIGSFLLDENRIYIEDTEVNFLLSLYFDNPDLGFQIQDYLLITLDVNIEPEPLVSPTILSLITLIPLIISASLLTYLYKGIRNREL